MRTLPLYAVRPTELRLTWTRLAIVALAALLITADFSKALLELVRRWGEQEEYSHGFLIPIVTIWLLWTRRDQLRESLGKPSWLGPILILIALIMHVLAELGAVFIVSQVGFVITLAGLALAVGGYQLLKVCLIPIVFLLFAIPIPYSLEAVLTLQLQLISSELGTLIIRTFGIPVYLDGNIIDLGNYKLQVAEACSGLRYLYPLLGLSFLAAYLFRAPFWQRMIIFLSAVPISIGMNGLRIGLVGIMVDRWGPVMADQTLHMFEGWIIFLACAALLFAEMYLLSLVSGKSFLETFLPSRHPAKISNEQHGILYPPRPLAASLAVLCIGTIVVFRISDRAEAIPQRTSFVEFPLRIGPWQGNRSVLDTDSLRALRLDDYILSDYVRPGGDAVNFYVAYYASQRTGESPHSPTVCVPGGGWMITNLRQIKYAAARGQFPINRALIIKGTDKELVYYWFDERGRVVASEFWAKAYLLIDAIVRNRTDGALIRLTTPVKPNEPEGEADRRLQSFMRSTLPRLKPFLPDRPAPRPILAGWQYSSRL